MCRVLPLLQTVALITKLVSLSFISYLLYVGGASLSLSPARLHLPYLSYQFLILWMFAPFWLQMKDVVIVSLHNDSHSQVADLDCLCVCVRLTYVCVFLLLAVTILLLMF